MIKKVGPGEARNTKEKGGEDSVIASQNVEKRGGRNPSLAQISKKYFVVHGGRRTQSGDSGGEHFKRGSAQYERGEGHGFLKKNENKWGLVKEREGEKTSERFLIQEKERKGTPFGVIGKVDQIPPKHD